MLRKGKKGNVTLYIVFFIVSILIITITAVLAPFGVLFNTEMYRAGEGILVQANGSISAIGDDDVRASIQGAINSAFAAQENNITVNANIYQYAWVPTLILSMLIIFMFSRQLVESRGGRTGFV